MEHIEANYEFHYFMFEKSQYLGEKQKGISTIFIPPSTCQFILFR